MEVRSRAQQLVERALELAQVQGGECCAQKQELVSCLRALRTEVCGSAHSPVPASPILDPVVERKALSSVKKFLQRRGVEMGSPPPQTVHTTGPAIRRRRRLEFCGAALSQLSPHPDSEATPWLEGAGGDLEQLQAHQQQQAFTPSSSDVEGGERVPAEKQESTIPAHLYHTTRTALPPRGAGTAGVDSPEPEVYEVGDDLGPLMALTQQVEAAEKSHTPGRPAHRRGGAQVGGVPVVERTHSRSPSRKGSACGKRQQHRTPLTDHSNLLPLTSQPHKNWR